ncbi:MAG: redoxin family protein [Prolixibacteraceae bacterium]|nr:redoxin family protein [Prolixibacteraceae bacterium]
MKNQLYEIFIVFTIILFFAACGNNKTKTSVESDFTPNPIVREKQEVNTLSIGAKAPAFNLPDENGIFVSIDDFKQAELLVVVFTCNHCPTAQAYEERLINFTSDYKEKGVSVVAIMPTSSAGLLPEECAYSDLDDSFENMAVRAKDKGFNFPYLYDGDDQAVSIKYGPTTTPHAFVFDNERKLQYVGRLDSIEKPGTANADDLRRAVDELLAGEPVSVPVTKTFGCSVKWSWKSDWAKKVNKQWENKPVTIEMIDDAGIRELLLNPTENLLLVNVWATWCAPCLVELPEMVNLQRMYGNRKFEFVTLSSDDPEKKDEALAALKKVHSPLKNYIYSDADRYKLIELIDEEWNGGLPYTLLIEPGGNVVYKLHGAVDLLELKKKIVEHPLLGRYF